MGDLPMRWSSLRATVATMFRARFLVAGVLGVGALLSGCSVDSDEPSSGDSYSVGALVMTRAEILDDLVNAFTDTVRR